jgi:hypothetical protein
MIETAPTRRTVPPREVTARRLLRASAQRSFDPRTDVDWERPWDDDRFFVPEQSMALFGTELWEQMTRAHRIELSRCELANTVGMGIWFELTFFPLLVGNLLRQPLGSAHLRYGLTEIADECRHSAMFSTMLGKLARGPYRFNQADYDLTLLLRSVPLPALTWVAVLFVEEVFDSIQRRAMADEAVQPVARQIFKIHVMEEARHIRFARDELVRTMPGVTSAQRHALAAAIGMGLGLIARALRNPEMYAAAGLDPRRAQSAAAANPLHHAFLGSSVHKMLPFFDDLGLVTPASQILWRRAGFMV